VSGTLAYMAPEVLRGEPADVRSDLWALGVMLYQTVTGTLPFRGTTPFEISSGDPAGFDGAARRVYRQAWPASSNACLPNSPGNDISGRVKCARRSRPERKNHRCDAGSPGFARALALGCRHGGRRCGFDLAGRRGAEQAAEPVERTAAQRRLSRVNERRGERVLRTSPFVWTERSPARRCAGATDAGGSLGGGFKVRCSPSRVRLHSCAHNPSGELE
jgi:serine/threonine protein kinase